MPKHKNLGILILTTNLRAVKKIDKCEFLPSSEDGVDGWSTAEGGVDGWSTAALLEGGDGVDGLRRWARTEIGDKLEA